MRKRFVLSALLLSFLGFFKLEFAQAQVVQSDILITQIRPANASTARLVELYNNSDISVDITDWCVHYSAANSAPSSSVSTDNQRSCFTTEDVSERLFLEPRSHMVVAANMSGFTGDFPMTGGLGSGSAGHAFITNSSKEIKDVVGWGIAAHAEANSPVAITDAIVRILERRQAASGVYIDTNNNADDFFNSSWREAYSIGNISEEVDLCLNIDDLQATVPDGLVRDEVTGACQEPQAVNACEGLILSEIGANLPNEQQFIEVHNETTETVDLTGCKLMTNRSTTNAFVFGEEVLASGAHRVVSISETSLTLTKTTTGTVYLVSSDGADDIDEQEYKNLRTDTSWAWFEDDQWRQTYRPTPGLTNIFQEFLPCLEGQERNEETGRCRNVPVAATLADCGPGRYRHPETNRCRSVTSTANALKPCAADQYRNPETNRCRKIGSGSTLKPCAADQYRNPETNRCRKIDSGSSLKPCNPGQERNPETNRCRKIPEILSAATNPAAIPDNRSKPLGFNYRVWGTLGVAVVGYGLYEYRNDARQMLSRLRSKRMKHKPPG